MCHRLAQRLNHSDVDAGSDQPPVPGRAFASHPEIGEAMRADLAAVFDRDPACHRYMEPLLYFKGFHALVTHRFAHELWIDPAGATSPTTCRARRRASSPWTFIRTCRIGKGILIDHGTGIVIGETAVIGDNVSILQEVTLGGNGKESGDRHPKIGDNVLLAAGAKVLGNIRVGNCSRIAAGSVVLKEVPPNTTVAGVPAKIVGPAGCPEPARTMDQRLAPSDCGCQDKA